MSTKQLTRSAISVVLIAIGAQINITVAWVPFTLQIFVISLLAYTLSQKELFFTLVVYVVLGLFGLPIFARGSGGLMMISKPTMGFIIGFTPFALLLKKHPIIAYGVLYTIGLAYLYTILNNVYEVNITINSVILQYGLMFVPTDFISILSAKKLAKKIPIKIQ